MPSVISILPNFSKDFVKEFFEESVNGSNSLKMFFTPKIYNFPTIISVEFDLKENMYFDVFEKESKLKRTWEYVSQKVIAEGWNINPNRFLLEMHRYDLTKPRENELVYPEFDWHKDDGAAVNFNTVTVIIYLRKDPELLYGNFQYDVDDHGIIVKVEPGMCIMFSGDLFHRPEPMTGTGKRESIVFQFERL